MGAQVWSGLARTIAIRRTQRLTRASSIAIRSHLNGVSNMRATLSSAALLSIVSGAFAEPCCQHACEEDTSKYWRIIMVNETTVCEETCMGWYKAKAVCNLYERDLKEAPNGTNTPCADEGYEIYETTVDNGYGSLWSAVSVISDRYAQAPMQRFMDGVADALGYKDFKGCFTDAHEVYTDLREARRLYKEGGKLDKAKAMVKLGAAVKDVMTTLQSCNTATADVERYAKLVKDLNDPRYYTLHNALTLALNIAEDHDMIATLMDDLESENGGREYQAGKLVVVTVLDVLERPGIPDANSSAAVQVAVGIADGFVGHVDIQCFSKARVEIKAIVGGLYRLLTHFSMAGLQSVFSGIMDLPATYKICMADKPAIMNLLKICRDFRHPKQLAELLFDNMVDHAEDITIQVVKGVLAFEGKEWRHVGQAVGTILNKIAISTSKNMTVVV